MSNPTAGSGEPFWYEWTVGLQKIVEMLRTDSDVLSVTLQAHGTKGWDDVVVKRSHDRREFFQVKHSRAEGNLTFGSLVAIDEKGSSLLQELFRAFCEMELSVPNDSCLVFTNREAGTSHGRSQQGHSRPPLLKFTEWLKAETKKCTTVSQLVPPKEWNEAWKEWLSQLAGVSDAKVFDFLRAFDVKTNQLNLTDLTDSLLDELAEIFGSQRSQVRPLLHAFDHALRDWTRSGIPITAEIAMDALALERETRGEHRAPPPPAPFFPSRQPFIEDLESLLVDESSPSVIFLSAEPGAGKTSALSELANRRTATALQGVVGIRYFAFRPITPESPIIPADADRFVDVESLWFDLLRQLRRGLMGRLRAFRVPVRDELLNWQQAREHVLRISSLLGKELGHPFVIAIDGIDHAARAAIYDSTRARDFFSSLPAPEELESSGIRILLAGQPARNYPQYPQWLRTPSETVRELSLSVLRDEDIELLLTVSAPRFPAAQRMAAVRTIQEITGGNTLSVVFAAAEAALISDVELLRDRLLERRLQSGITSYYQSIWEHCLAGESQDIGSRLAGIICLARERLTGGILSSILPQVGWNPEKWTSLLRRLGPLLVEENDGFRVRHNDIRVFLQGRLSTVSEEERKSIVSNVADYYLKPDCNRRIAHESLFQLLKMAGREADSVRLFSADWVVEAIALGVDCDDIERQCSAALSQVYGVRDWELLARLSCACETLERWRETQEYAGSEASPRSLENVPAFLRSETFVRPMREWDSEILRRLADDAQELFDIGESDRATALMSRWVGGLNLAEVCTALTDLEEGPKLGKDPQLGPSAENTLEALGRACRLANLNLTRESCNEGVLADSALAFEKGWVAVSCERGPWDSMPACFGDEPMHFFETIIQAASALVAKKHWSLVSSLFVHYKDGARDLALWQPLAAYKAAWWSLISSQGNSDSAWLESVKGRDLKKDFSGDSGIYTAIYSSKLRGWQDAVSEPGTIAHQALEAMALNEYRDRDRPVYALWLRVAATIGRIAGALSRRGTEFARDILRPKELQELLTALWNPTPALRAFQDTSIAGKLAEELIEIVVKLGEGHMASALEAVETPLKDWPIDGRRGSIWLLLRAKGEFPILRQWIQNWLGENGRIWASSGDDRDALINNWRPFAGEIGETELVEKAYEKQAWSRISYRTDRDESFFAGAEFLDHLLKVRPKRWTTLGSRLWSQSYAASALGGDINQAWGIDRSLAKAAFRLEPDSICRLVFSEIPYRDDYWYERIRDALIGGLTDVVHENRFDSKAKLSLWSLANGFCRWFSEHDVGLLCQLKSALLDSEPTGAKKNVLERRLHELTPGEMVRVPRKVEESQDDMTAVSDQETLSASLDAILKGKSPSIHECVRLIADVIREQPNSKDIIRRLTFQMVNRQNWASSWRFEGVFRELLKLGTLLSEEQMWDLVKAACSEADRGTHWLQAVTSNLHTLLIAWGIRRGGDELERFLICHLEMHELWIKGGRRNLPYSEISIPQNEFASTWEETSAQILVFLLNSRSGEVVSSALRGIHALVRQQPKIIPFIFGILGGDSWKSRWILNSTEAWAFIYPEFTEKARSSIEEWFVHDSLEHRLQAWLILVSLAESKGGEKPGLPWPKEASSGEPERERLRDVLDLPPEKVGLMHIATRHRSADQHLKILEVVFGDLPKVRHRAAQLLDDVPTERHLQHPWPASMRQRNDTDIGLPDIGYIVGKALDSSMSGPPLKAVPKLAQAFMPNEEPWVVADSPLPDPGANGWPGGPEFGDYRTPPDTAAIRRKLLLFACEHNISEGEHVLAGTVEIYTDSHDFHFHTWWEHVLDTEAPIRTRKPTTISARTFSWWLGDWWEDRYREENYPIAFVPGGSQRLTHSFVSWFPSKMWLDGLNWKPHPKNPRIWQRDGRLMARFEQFHGELRDTRGYHSRQSMISRWVASEEAWEQMQKIGEWRLVDYIEVEMSPEK